MAFLVVTRLRLRDPGILMSSWSPRSQLLISEQVRRKSRRRGLATQTRHTGLGRRGQIVMQ